jgi:hypothetical protein
VKSLTYLVPWLLLTGVSGADTPHPGDAPSAAKAQQADDDDDQKSPNPPGTPLALSRSQQEAVGIRIDHPLALSASPPLAGFGTVLDPVALVTDLGRVESTQAASAAAAADAARLERLYHDESQASLKAWQLAQAQAAEARAQERAALLTFNLQWGPLASLGPAQRLSLLDGVSHGHALLLRADLPGRPAGTAVERRALVQVDGVSMAAQVLGPLPRTDPVAQSAAWLLEIEHAPPGLGPGARALVTLQGAHEGGLLVPAAALIYEADSAYVFRASHEKDAPTLQYSAVAVKPRSRVGAAWLVDGLNRSDEIVVQGAGVLWSLQGIGSFSAAEEDHD